MDVLKMQVRTRQPCRGLTSVVMRFLCVPSDNAEDVMVSGFVSEQLTSSMTAVFHDSHWDGYGIDGKKPSNVVSVHRQRPRLICPPTASRKVIKYLNYKSKSK